MSTQKSAYRFSKIFNAAVTFGSVSTKTGAKGPYIMSQGATVVKPNGTSETRTVMAFNNAAVTIKKLARKGKTVTLAVQYDGGVMKVIGLPREAAPAAVAA